MEFLTLKKEILDDIVAKHVPEDILTRVSVESRLMWYRVSKRSSQYMMRTMDGPAELWRMRKQFALQMASINFLTFVFCLANRFPSRYHLSRSTGQLTMSELTPSTRLIQINEYALRCLILFDRHRKSCTDIRFQRCCPIPL